MAIENIGLVTVTENATKKVAIKAGAKIKAKAGTKYLFQVENSDVAPENVTVKRVGKDLLVSFEGSEKPDLTIEDFFAEGMDGQLYGVAEDGQLYAYVRTDGEGFYGPLTLADGESAPIALGGEGVPYTASTDDAAGFLLWPWLLGLAAVGAGAAAIINNNKDDGHKTKTSAAPTNTKVMDDVGPIQGELHNGDITDDSHPEISGNGVPGAVIHVFDNGQEIGSTTVNPDGTWSFTPELADGAHSFDITQVVPGQKPSAPIHVIDIVIDTVPPADPFAVIDGSRSDGEHTYSNDNKPEIHGKGEPGDTITIILPNGEELHTVVDENGDWVAPRPVNPLPEGNNEIKVIERDEAGNESETILPVIIDTIPPAKPEAGLDPDSDTGTKGDGITSDTTPTIDGKSEPGADITIIFPDGEELHTKADENGDWSVTPTKPLPEGDNEITIIATDEAGNDSEPTIIHVVIDTKAPDAPEAHLDPESDSGTKGDNITNDNTPTIDGKTEAGADITIIFPTGEEIHTKADENGDWSVTPTQPLPEGKNDITIIATDEAGNASEPTVITVDIDTKAPDAPDAWLDEASDSGTKGDNITNETLPTIDGKTEPGADITIIFPTGEEIHTKADENGNWNVTPTKPLSEGDNEITVIATDEAGNASEPTVINVIIDTTPPDASKLAITGVLDDVGSITGNIANGGSTDDSHPTISGTGTAGEATGLWPFSVDTSAPDNVNNLVVTDDVGAVTGPLHDGDTTDDNHPTFSGEAEKGATVIIYDNGEKIGEADVGPDGKWEFTPTQPLDDGEHAFTTEVVDEAGNSSGQNEPLHVVIDTTGLGVNIIQVLDDVGSITGAIQLHGVTDDTRPEIQGTSKPGSIVKISDNGVELGSTTADADGKWSFTPSKDLAEGPHSIVAIATDKAGNVSEPSKFDFSIDTTAPTKPSIDSVTDDVGAIQGPIPNGGVTDDSTPTLSGKAEAGSVVTVYDNGEKIGSVVADKDGDWSFTPTTPINEGPHAFTVDATDKAGNTSEQSEPFNIVTDYTAPDMPTITGVLDDVGLVTGNIENGGKTDDSRPVISGEGTAGDIITVYANDSTGNHPIGSTVVGEDGKWSLTPETPLNVGLNDLTAVETDPAGNSTQPSAPYSFTLDTAEPGVPVIVNVLDDVGPYTGFLQKGDVTDDNKPTINGTAEAGSTVKLYDGNNVLIGSAIADADGNWSITPETALADGKHEVYATATNDTGVVSQPTGKWNFEVDTSAPSNVSNLVVTDDVGPKTGVLYDGDTTDDNRPTFSGDAVPNGKVIIYDNGKKIGEADVSPEGKWEHQRQVQ
ncbi:Ig-like domain-containing protein [Pseudomonas sp. Pseusp97]|uniref:Ig-like domain-containing protein n=1 Tax=Pseudomonas sp. Pseusp97 TaxID=3243065 RepID=UPI0039A473D8